MATIVMFAKTHKSACLCNLGADDELCYDDNISAYFGAMRKDCAVEGFEFEVDYYSENSSCYRVVDEADCDEYERAHTFMSSYVDFWDTI